MHLRWDRRAWLMIAAGILLALVLTYFAFPGFSEFVDECAYEGWAWIESRVLSQWPFD